MSKDMKRAFKKSDIKKTVQKCDGCKYLTIDEVEQNGGLYISTRCTKTTKKGREIRWTHAHQNNSYAQSEAKDRMKSLVTTCKAPSWCPLGKGAVTMRVMDKMRLTDNFMEEEVFNIVMECITNNNVQISDESIHRLKRKIHQLLIRKVEI